MKEHANTAITDVLGVFAQLPSDMIQMMPGLLTLVVMLVVGVFSAYVLKWCSAGLIRWGARILPERLSSRPLIRNNIVLFERCVGRLVFYIIIFLTITTLLKKMGLDVAAAWFQNIAKYLPNLIVAFVVTLFGWKLKEQLEGIVCRGLIRAGFTQARIASAVLSWTVFIISALVALEQIGIDMGLVITISTVLSGVVAGGIALTFSLGAKPIIADILCCYQMHRYMKTGQSIRIANYEGVIASIGPTCVVINTDNGQVVLSGSQFRESATLIQKQ
jgi:small-conductance mechanosensitive channel